MLRPSTPTIRDPTTSRACLRWRRIPRRGHSHFTALGADPTRTTYKLELRELISLSSRPATSTLQLPRRSSRSRSPTTRYRQEAYEVDSPNDSPILPSFPGLRHPCRDPTIASDDDEFTDLQDEDDVADEQTAASILVPPSRQRQR
ncbi:hypothetical protein A4X09_0g7485 [Tilletia walkeri]|uniref:Uncharacterized protein n=1 Tax=Tilletia walkeri TaxID=117179 RepID=A0A8X7N222_9BASI|nr:hypothetical protein A4X09_0g7485 [Tilletia walkeri]